jgi:hypothetical protein
MANEQDNEKFGKEGQDREFGEKKQQPIGQQGQQPEFGQKGQQPLGQQGQSSSGQADRGKSGDTETLSTERGFGQGAGGGQSGSGQTGSSGGNEGVGGFVGSQGSGSSDYLREEADNAPDFASQGQGATEGRDALDNPDEDIETGQIRRDNDIEGGTGA